MAVQPTIFPARRSTDGHQIVEALNQGILVSRGEVSGRTSITIESFISTSGTAEEDVWANTGLITWATTATAMDIVSTVAADDGNPTTNTGLQTLTVTGLASDFTEQTVTYTMNGVTNVTTAETWIRVNKVVGATFGTYHGSNEGIITIRVTGGGAIVGNIPVGVSSTQKSHYTVPAGKTAYITRFDLNVDAAKTSTFRLHKSENADDITQPFSGGKVLLHRVDGVSGSHNEILHVPIRVPEKSDIWWTVEAGAAGTDIHVDYDMDIIDN
jgi:hypothetical protein